MTPVKLHKLLLRTLVPVFLLIALAGAISGCSRGEGSQKTSDLIMAPLADMPDDVRSAPVTVQDAYRFAVGNPDLMQQLPCYCGCGAMGHTSNYACYVSGQNADGSPIYDSHALGCSICVDITQDAMRLLKEGKSVPEIRSYIDSTYSQYGPSNMP
jgi:hypothetical protein